MTATEMAVSHTNTPPSTGSHDAAEGFAARYYSFNERPASDSCWSLSTGPDGRIYAASCIEHTAGESATVVRYDEARDRLDYLFDMDVASGDLRDSGRATQCKIHYSFAPSPSTGVLYAATHLSGAPKGERFYCPWMSWHDERRCFRGAMLVAYDTGSEELLWSDLMIPREGCRCLCLDEARERLYALTYPRDHLVMYDLRRRELKDLGRIGSVNSQCLFLDARSRVYLTDDAGRFLRFDPERDRIERLPHVMPHAGGYQNGWHGVLYDAVADPAGECVYTIPWMVNPRLSRFYPLDGPDGRLEDLGPLNQERDPRHPISMSLDHAGGLVFGIDGWLYLVHADWDSGTEERTTGMWNYRGHGIVMRIHPGTLERQRVCVLERPGACSHYVSRGARDARGNLYFGHVGPRPVGIFRVTVPGAGTVPDAHHPLRVWG